MSDKIMVAVEEVKVAGLALKAASDSYDATQQEFELIANQLTEARLAVRDAERKLKGIIFEETQT